MDTYFIEKSLAMQDFYKDLKKINKDTFIEKYGEPLYKLVSAAKSGNISITKISNNRGYLLPNEGFSGHTELFNEGLSLWIFSSNSYYHTSIIKHIDWENNIFSTKNSQYSFKFEEDGIRTANKA